MAFTKEEARIKIQKLVEDFRAHEATLEHVAEAQIENNFILPLFRYLNWNTENEGLTHVYYEFKAQVTDKKRLHTFKDKFHPRWEPRYLVYPAVGSLPQVLSTLLHVHSGMIFYGSI